MNLDLCANWTWRKLSGHSDSWKLAPQLIFSPVGSAQETLLGGDWKVNKQQLSQQNPPEDMTFRPGRSEGNGECVCDRCSVTQFRPPANIRRHGPGDASLNSSLAIEAQTENTGPEIQIMNLTLLRPSPPTISRTAILYKWWSGFFSVALKPCLYSSAALNSFPLWPLLNLSLSC